jgi:hypothetical protein
MDQMQTGASQGTHPADISRVLGNLRLKQHHVKHGLHGSPKKPGRKRLAGCVSQI